MGSWFNSFPHERSHVNQDCTDFFQVIPPVAIAFSEVVIGSLLILRTRALYKEAKSQLSIIILVILIFIYLIQLALSVVSTIVFETLVA